MHTYYDPDQPPPDHVVIPIAEFDRIKDDISKLFICQAMLRRLLLFAGGALTDDEVVELRGDIQHFERDVSLWGS
jgi:hypothetical protein